MCPLSGKKKGKKKKNQHWIEIGAYDGLVLHFPLLPLFIIGNKQINISISWIVTDYICALLQINSVHLCFYIKKKVIYEKKNVAYESYLMLHK